MALKNHKSAHGRPVRVRRPRKLFPGMISSLLPPRRVRHPSDVLPEALSGDIDTQQTTTSNPTGADPSFPSEQPQQNRLRTAFRTLANSFGLLREYQNHPNHPPPRPDLAVSPCFDHPSQFAAPKPLDDSYTNLVERVQSIIAPLPNLSTFRVALWFYTGGSVRSQNSGDGLIHDVLLAEDFDPSDLAGVNFAAINKLLDDIDTRTDLPGCGDGWRSSNIQIFIPKPRSRLVHNQKSNSHVNPEEYGEPFVACGFRHRSLTEVIKAHFSMAPRSRTLHHSPHKLIWVKDDGSEERIHGELYQSDAWLAEHEAIQDLEIDTEEPCSRERSIAALMLYSDATHVAQFGQNSIWPVYLYFGNESKYYRRKPTARVCEHIGFLLKVGCMLIWFTLYV